MLIFRTALGQPIVVFLFY